MNGQQQMYYPNYSYNGFQMPYYGQRAYNPTQQPAQIQTQQPQMNYQSPIQGFYFSNETEAKAFVITQPNTNLVFVDRTKGKAFLKSTDNMCASTTRYFNLIETDENGNNLNEKKVDTPKDVIDPTKFVEKEQLKGLVTVAQYDELLKNYKFLEEQLRIMQKQINGGKQFNGTATNN